MRRVVTSLGSSFWWSLGWCCYGNCYYGNTSVHICVLWEERFSIIALNLDLTRRGEREGREGRREREREGREGEREGRRERAKGGKEREREGERKGREGRRERGKDRERKGREGRREKGREGEKGVEWMYMYKTLRTTTCNGTVSLVCRILSTDQSLLFPMFIIL